MTIAQRPRFNIYLWWGDEYIKRRPDSGGWKLRFKNVRQFTLRDRVRKLRAEGWETAHSILVERVEPPLTLADPARREPRSMRALPRSGGGGSR